MTDFTSTSDSSLSEPDTQSLRLDRFRLDEPSIQADPYAYYPLLRDQKPVMRTTVGGQTWWVLSRHEDIVRVLMDPRTFSSRTLPDASILFLDPPEHDRLRAMVMPWFSRTAVHRLEGPIVAHAGALIGKAAVGSRCDMIEDIAVPLTVTMISAMLGIPPAAVERLRGLRRLGPDFLSFFQASQLGTEPSPAARAAREEVDAALGGVIDGDFEEGGVVADLVKHMNKDDLTRPECLSYVNILFGAGHSTTTDLIGNTAYVLTKRSGDLNRIAQEPSFAGVFLEEVLRTRPSFQRIPRVTTRDVEIAGEKIPSGSLIRLLLGSANRDPAHCEDAEIFDPDAKRRMHLAFGKGIHTCLGNWLARLEGTIALQVLSRFVEKVDLDPHDIPSSHAGGTFNNFGFSRLPVLLHGR